MAETYFTVIPKYKRIPFVLREPMFKWFMENRSEVVDVVKSHLDEINDEFAKTGEPFAFDDFVEGINPKYVELMRKRLEPFLSEINQRQDSAYRFAIDEFGDIVGRLDKIEGSKLFIILKPVSI